METNAKNPTYNELAFLVVLNDPCFQAALPEEMTKEELFGKIEAGIQYYKDTYTYEELEAMFKQ